MPPSNLTTRLFVYGTLKHGFYNHRVYLNHAQTSGTAEFLGTAHTADAMALIIRGPRNIPALLEIPKKTAVQGEVYSITDSVLQAMDLLEGVATGFYYRAEKVVRWTDSDADNNKECRCWVYLQNLSSDEKEDLSSQPCFYSEYSKELHESYIPPRADPDPDILQLLQQQKE